MTRFKSRLTALAVALTTLLFLGLGAAGTASAAPRQALDPAPVPVTGALANGTGAVNGTFDVQRFANQNGQLTAIGTFTGTVTDAAGNVTSGTQQISLPVNVAQSTGSCQILDLVLGPLDLDLLGLQVHLDTVHLNITAQQGPGNLLGNLLCAVAGLLDGPTGVNSIITNIARLLNQLLGAL
ncbi:hypothetical protein ABZV93_11970 [Actinopolymorpha sp. NPDC004070]|uniref:hypothetical protein n=1 Tax=Actinopolymorpha sp. NPDC004070 TaxID=3154548 RepID=UPI0033B94AA8